MTKSARSVQNAGMLSRYWPVVDLRLCTPRVELRLPDSDDLAALAALAEEGVHGSDHMPFVVPWTDCSPRERGRNVVQWQWRTQAEWTAAHWELTMVVVADGAVVGSQSVSASDFAVVREVATGSWLGFRHHGRGLGTEMRAAVLHLAFAGLGAESAISSAFDDNPASLGVSRKLGYRPDGTIRSLRRGELATQTRLRLSRSDWTERPDITISGLEPCLPLFGLGEESQDDAG